MYTKELIETFEVPASSNFAKQFKINRKGLVALEFSASISDFMIAINDKWLPNQYTNPNDFNELLYITDIETFIPVNKANTLFFGPRQGDALAGYNDFVKIDLKAKSGTGTGNIQYKVYALYSEVQSNMMTYKAIVTDSGTGEEYIKDISGFGNMKIEKTGGATDIMVFRNGLPLWEFPNATSKTIILGKNTLYTDTDMTTIRLRNTATSDTIKIHLRKVVIIPGYNPPRSNKKPALIK